MFAPLATCLLALATLTSALPTTITERDGACNHGPNTRSCWKDGFSVSTNSYQKTPDTGKTVKYTLEASEMVMAPDGFDRPMMVFNKQYPGPTIVADWGDNLEITVINNLKDNGTSVHWHGFRQHGSNQMDGTNGITECPIAPGQSRVYKFRATEYGSSWYHSHHSVQYGDGLVGGIQIRGPSTANYDVDLGVMSLTNWFHTPIFDLLASGTGAPPTSQSILVNGSAVYNGKGKYSTTKLQPGKKHKLSIVNTGLDNYFHVSLDNHPFTVVAADFVPIKPYTTTSLSLAIGQRYDVIIDAKEKKDNYWFRVGTSQTSGDTACDPPVEARDNYGAIFQYDGASSGNPTSTSYTLGTGCTQETNIVPYVPISPSAPTEAPTKIDITLVKTKIQPWKVNNVSMVIDWNTPSLKYIQDGKFDLPDKDNGFVINKGENDWVYWTISNETPIPHPIHLHGHDFNLVAFGAGTGVGAALNLNNPIRRDTVNVDGNGFITIAFKADNPGAWLLHCHIAFHISGGLGLQFLERPKDIIKSLGDMTIFNDGCKAWNAYKGPGDRMLDSGL